MDVIDGRQSAAGGTESARGVVAGAFLLLDTLAREGSAGLSRLSQLSGLPKSSTYRLLRQLVEVDAVARDGRGYRLGGAAHRLAVADASQAWLRRAAFGPGQRLAEDSGASVVVLVPREEPHAGARVVAAYVPADGPCTALSDVGALVPPGTAAGQVLLAEDPVAVAPPPFSEAEWRRARAAISARGAAVDEQIFVRGVCCAAAVVRRPDGQPAASVAAMVSAERIPLGLVEKVRRAASAISRAVAAQTVLPPGLLPSQGDRAVGPAGAEEERTRVFATG